MGSRPKSATPLLADDRAALRPTSKRFAPQAYVALISPPLKLPVEHLHSHAQKARLRRPHFGGQRCRLLRSEPRLEPMRAHPNRGRRARYRPKVPLAADDVGRALATLWEAEGKAREQRLEQQRHRAHAFGVSAAVAPTQGRKSAASPCDRSPAQASARTQTPECLPRAFRPATNGHQARATRRGRSLLLCSGSSPGAALPS